MLPFVTNQKNQMKSHFCFAHRRWAKRAGPEAHAALLDKVVQHIQQGHLIPPK
jgi:hypothetical protein